MIGSRTTFSHMLAQFLRKNRILIGYSVLILTSYCLPIGKKIALHTHEVAHIRLDYLMHSILLIPFGFFSIRLHKAGNVTFYCIALLTAAAIETLHFLIPDRSFNWYDMCANLIGTAIGILVREIMYRWKYAK